jgi:hypothetical protein
MKTIITMQAPENDRHREDDPSAADQSTTLGPPVRPVFHLARRVWNPTPIPKPAIPTDLEQLSWPERSAEVVRHALLSIEHWLSSGGWLREWIRLNLWLGVVLIVAALLVVPPVTALLEGVRDWTGLLGATIGNINVAVAALPPIILALATAFLAVKLIQRHRASRRPNRRQDFDHYS